MRILSYRRRCAVAFGFFALSLSTPALSAAEPDPGPVLLGLLLGGSSLTVDEEKQVAHNFRLGSQTYLAKLERISEATFLERTDLSAQKASIMVLAARAARENMAIAVDAAKLLETSHTDRMDAVFGWVVIVRALAVQQANMEMLQKAGLVESEWPVTLDVVLPGIFDKLILPKIRPHTTPSREGQTP